MDAASWYVARGLVAAASARDAALIVALNPAAIADPPQPSLALLAQSIEQGQAAFKSCCHDQNTIMIGESEDGGVDDEDDLGVPPEEDSDADLTLNDPSLKAAATVLALMGPEVPFSVFVKCLSVLDRTRPPLADLHRLQRLGLSTSTFNGGADNQAVFSLRMNGNDLVAEISGRGGGSHRVASLHNAAAEALELSHRMDLVCVVGRLLHHYSFMVEAQRHRVYALALVGVRPSNVRALNVATTMALKELNHTLKRQRGTTNHDAENEAVGGGGEMANATTNLMAARQGWKIGGDSSNGYSKSNKAPPIAEQRGSAPWALVEVWRDTTANKGTIHAMMNRMSALKMRKTKRTAVANRNEAVGSDRLVKASRAMKLARSQSVDSLAENDGSHVPEDGDSTFLPHIHRPKKSGHKHGSLLLSRAAGRPCEAQDDRLAAMLRPLVGIGVDLYVMNGACGHRGHHRLGKNARSWMPRDMELLRQSVPSKRRPDAKKGQTASDLARRMLKNKTFINTNFKKPKELNVQVEVRKVEAVDYWGWRSKKPSSNTEVARLLGL